MVYVVIYIKIQVPSIVVCKLEEVSPIFPDVFSLTAKQELICLCWRCEL